MNERTPYTSLAELLKALEDQITKLKVKAALADDMKDLLERYKTGNFTELDFENMKGIEGRLIMPSAQEWLERYYANEGQN